MSAAVIAAVAVAAAAACPAPSVPPAPHEPTRMPGPTELIAGLYMQGGAIVMGCPQLPRGPYAGTLTVTSVRSGRVVARRTHARAGRLFAIGLPAGVYRVGGRIAGGLQAMARIVRIPAGHSVRQDLFVDVP